MVEVVPRVSRRTEGRRCHHLGSRNHSCTCDRQMEVVEGLWGTFSADSRADMRAGSRVPKRQKRGLISGGPSGITFLSPTCGCCPYV